MFHKSSLFAKCSNISSSGTDYSFFLLFEGRAILNHLSVGKYTSIQFVLNICLFHLLVNTFYRHTNEHNIIFWRSRHVKVIKICRDARKWEVKEDLNLLTCSCFHKYVRNCIHWFQLLTTKQTILNLVINTYKKEGKQFVSVQRPLLHYVVSNLGYRWWQVSLLPNRVV